MIDQPHIVHTDAVRTAFIHINVPRDQIQTAMEPGLNELMDTLKAQGVTPAGAWFTHHMRMDPEIFDFDICVPVGTPTRPEGRVQPGELPAATVARAVYRGPYEGLPAAWLQLGAWVATNSLTPANDLWEVYTAGPETSPDSSKWQTELNRPLVGWK